MKFNIDKYYKSLCNEIEKKTSVVTQLSFGLL